MKPVPENVRCGERRDERILPAMKIRAKVIVSLINQGQVLLSEGYDPKRDCIYYIPVGGGVEFGETLYDAAIRELSEEIGVTDQKLEFVNFHESIFTIKELLEHEIMFHYFCHIEDSVREALPPQGIESNGQPFKVSWFSRDELLTIQKNLVPAPAYDEIQSVRR